MKPIEEYTSEELCSELEKRYEAIFVGFVNQTTLAGEREISVNFIGDTKAIGAILTHGISRLGQGKVPFDEMLDWLKQISVFVLRNEGK
jgi:hypothetical protein